MKTKTYNFWEALDLFRITQKPIPTIEKYQTYPDCREKSIERYLDGKFFGCVETIKVPIPEGRNPDELTLAHLQMGEDWESWRFTEKDEPLPEDAEWWNGLEWVENEGEKIYKNFTYRTRKPKGWFLTKKKITLGDCLDDEGNEVYNIPDQPDLEQEYLELYAHPYNTTVEMIDNLHKRLLRLEKGTK